MRDWPKILRTLLIASNFSTWLECGWSSRWKKKESRPAQGSLKRYDASAHRLLSCSAQGGRRRSRPTTKHRIPNAVSPGRSPKLGRGLYHLHLSIELIVNGFGAY